MAVPPAIAGRLLEQYVFPRMHPVVQHHVDVAMPAMKEKVLELEATVEDLRARVAALVVENAKLLARIEYDGTRMYNGEKLDTRHVRTCTRLGERIQGIWSRLRRLEKTTDEKAASNAQKIRELEERVSVLEL